MTMLDTWPRTRCLGRTAKALLAVAKYARGRFRGRAALTKRAEQGDLLALEELCQKLGVPLPEPEWGKKEQWRQQHAPITPLYEAYREAERAREPGARLARLVYESARRRLQAARKEMRPPPQPEPGRILRMARERFEAAESGRLAPIVEKATEEAQLRVARHGHENEIVLVEPGKEGAYADVEYVHPGEVGLPQAYSRKAVRVTLSRHTWHLAPGSTPYAHEGMIYLSPLVRVRQGRGTSLVTERLASGKGGRLLWRSIA